MTTGTQRAPEPKTIDATLKKSGNRFVFDVPDKSTVIVKEQVQWKVTVQDVKGDRSDVDLLVVFNNSDSKVSPLHWPFEGHGWSKTAHHGDPKKEQFAIDFPQPQTLRQTPPFVVHSEKPTKQQGDKKPSPIQYNYSLLASIPAKLLPRGVHANSNDSLQQWPNISPTGDKFLIVRHDPEMYVDEC